MTENNLLWKKFKPRSFEEQARNQEGKQPVVPEETALVIEKEKQEPSTKVTPKEVTKKKRRSKKKQQKQKTKKHPPKNTPSKSSYAKETMANSTKSMHAGFPAGARIDTRPKPLDPIEVAKAIPEEDSKRLGKQISDDIDKIVFEKVKGEFKNFDDLAKKTFDEKEIAAARDWADEERAKRRRVRDSIEEKDDLDLHIEEREKKSPGFKKLVDEASDRLKKEVKETVLPKEEESVISALGEKAMIDLPDLPLDDLEGQEAVDTSVEDEAGGSLVFGLLGAGQAGGRLVESFYNQGYKKVLVVNTSKHDLSGLKHVPENQKLVMNVGSGGAGKDMRKGEAAAEKHQQEIYEKMQKLFGPVDRILVCAGAGGGTGGGSVLTLVQTAKKYLDYIGVEDVSEKVGVLITLPTKGEALSPLVAENAHLVLTKLCEYAAEGEISPLILFDNQKIKSMYPKLSVSQFWSTVNKTVTGLFHIFNVLSTQEGSPTSFDKADYDRVLSAGGCMIMGMTSVKEYSDGTDISKAIRSNLERTLLCDGFDVKTARAAACIATASADILDNVPGLMDSLETGFDTLSNLTGAAAVFRGIYQGNRDKLSIQTLITGLDTPVKRLAELTKTKKKEVQTKKGGLYS